MKEFARINIGVDEAGDRLFSDLLRQYPGNKWSRTFIYRGPVDDERTRRILDVLNNSGRSPWRDTSRPMDEKGEFFLRVEREYDSQDFGDCLFLELHPDDESHVFDQPRRSGLAPLLKGSLNDQIDFAFTMPTLYYVTSRVRRILEAGGLIGLKFSPTLLLPGLDALATTEPIPWETHGEPWWELDSDFTMPPLSDSMTFTDMDGKILRKRDFSNGFHRRDGLYMHPELHYRASDIEKLKQFDLARTYEPFGNRKGYDRFDCPLIASKRFYDFCIQHGLKTQWVPVRIDPD